MTRYNTLKHLIKRLDQHKEWKEKVRDRDNNRCKECGSSENTEIHHVFKFADILNRFLKKYEKLFRQKNKKMLLKLAAEYTPFWSIKNGECLCHNCHMNKHKD